ncbi:MAG: ComF family protein [Clostridia bacterium]|nr:ComF family protein [Clostridia bacterium]
MSKKTDSLLFGKWGLLEKSAGKWIMDVLWPEGAFCCACGRVTKGGGLCGACRESLMHDGAFFAWERDDPEPGLTAWSLRPHDGVPRELILRLKYRAEARAAGLLSELLLPLPEDVSFPSDTVVTWVTMPESRRRERCIDHGRLLAETFAEKLGLNCRQLLDRRDRHEKSQATLNAAQRTANLAGAFTPKEKIGFPVLIIDDVRTTGTTLCRCAEALRSGGAEQLFALTVTAPHRGLSR